MNWDPSADPDDALPPGPKGETLSQKLRRLAVQLGHMEAEDPGPVKRMPSGKGKAQPLPKDDGRSFEERMDELFARREPGQEG